MVNQQLLVEFLRVYAFQPATAYWRAVEIDVFRKYLPGSGIFLDLGCGDGKLSVILFGAKPPKDFSVVGIDSDEDETRMAAGNRLYLRIHTCSASTIPEPSGSFDHVISNSVLEHIEDIEATLAEVSRLLKPGGTFTFTVPSAGFHSCLRGPLIPGIPREGYLKEMDERLAHFRYWNADQWGETLTSHGLLIKKQAEYLSTAETRRWESISRYTSGILSALHGNRKRPIELQRKFRLRQTQNRVTLPRWFAVLLGKVLSAGVTGAGETNACLLVQAVK